MWLILIERVLFSGCHNLDILHICCWRAIEWQPLYYVELYWLH